MNKLGVYYLMILILGCSYPVLAGKKIHALFIGNSYTYINNMPQIIAGLASSTGDTLIWDMHAPDGFHISDNYFAPGTISRINKGGWDYVVLQCQSQETAQTTPLFNLEVVTYVPMYDSFIAVNSPCAETVFYMTWGRKNGDSLNCKLLSQPPYNWPYYCTYEKMDSIIRERYRYLADIKKDIVSPVGAVRHYIRYNYPGIELYQPDESHASVAGAYAAACCFYTTLFRKDPLLTKYDHTLSSTDAANIRMAAKKVVYDSMQYWHIGQYKADADFSYATAGLQVNFTNNSVNALNYHWDFGDGQTSTVKNPAHTYTATGTYLVTLAITDNMNNCADTVGYTIALFPSGINNVVNTYNFVVSPNPATDVLNISSPLFQSHSCAIQIMNSVGQVIYNKPSTTSNLQNIPTSSLSKGMYLLLITGDKISYHTKFIKE